MKMRSLSCTDPFRIILLAAPLCQFEQVFDTYHTPKSLENFHERHFRWPVLRKCTFLVILPWLFSYF
eukprot:UN15629